MGKVGRKNTLEFRNVVESTILKLILKKCDGRAWTGLIWLETGTVQEVGICRHDNKTSGSIQYGEFLD